MADQLVDQAVFLLAATIRLATPLLLVALGETFAELSGVINLGAEGIMLMGAFAGVFGYFVTGNVWLGILLGIVVGGAMSIVMAFLSVTLRLNQILCGLAIFFAGLGLSSFLYYPLAPMGVQPLGTTSIPVLGDIPVIGPILFQQNILTYLAFILVPVFGIILYKTTAGIKIRATGEKPAAVDTLGMSVSKIRYLCVILGGVLAGLAGVYLSVAETGGFRENMVAGRGFMALGLVYFGKWNPYRIVPGVLLFGFFYALQVRLQAIGVDVPYQFLLLLPYILILVTLVLVGRKATGPAALGNPYKRGES